MGVSQIAIPPSVVSAILMRNDGPLEVVGGMTDGRRDSLKEVGALVRLILGAAIALDVSIFGWLTQNWDLSSRLAQAALALIVALTVTVWFLFETARAIARGMED